MTIRKRFDIPKRNDRCPCGSGHKFKKCCAHDAARLNSADRSRGVGYIDDGEEAVRWVISDGRGTSFFSDKDNRILVFDDKAVAFAVAGLAEFSEQEPGEINVAGVGAAKFKHLCEILPYVEVSDVEVAVGLVRERIAARQAQLASQEGTEDGNQEQQEVSEASRGLEDDSNGIEEEAGGTEAAP